MSVHPKIKELTLNETFLVRESLFVKRMHQKKTNAETLCKIWFVPFVLRLPSSMSDHDGK